MEDDVISRILADTEEFSNYETPFTHRTFQDLNSILDTNDSQFLDQFLSELLSRQSSLMYLIPPLVSAMDTGSSQLALPASKSYLSFLLIPNSPTLMLFTPVAFLSVLRSLRRSLKPRIVGSVGQCSASLSGVQVKKRKGGHPRNKRAESRHRDDDDDEHDRGASEQELLDIRLVLDVLEKLSLVLDLIHLNRFPDCSKSVAHTIVETPRLVLEVCANSRGFSRLVDLCSLILFRLLKAEHGDERETAAEVLKSLAPLILSVKSQARNFALGFTKKLITDVSTKSDGINKAVVNFPLYLVQRAPVKAEPRSLAVEAIIDIVKTLELQDQISFAGYVVRLTQGKANLRLLGVDLILNLLMLLKDPFKIDLEVEDANDSLGFKCLEALFQRSTDSCAAIRARALSNIAQLVGCLSTNEQNRTVLRNAILSREDGREVVEGGLLGLLSKRCMDEKANVRRASLTLVTKLTAFMGGGFDGALLKTIGMACLDPLVSIRKAAISALSEVLRIYPNGDVIVEWLHSVPRLIIDSESSIQEECENLFSELVLNYIAKAGSSPVPRNSSRCYTSTDTEIDLLFPKGVLVLMKEICNGDVMPWVKRICASLGRKKRLKPRVVVALQNIISISESNWKNRSMPMEKWTAPPGSWLLLSLLSVYVPKAIDWEFLYHHWQLLDKHGEEDEFRSPPSHHYAFVEEVGFDSNSISWAQDRVFLLQSISNVSVELPPDPAADIAHHLLNRIELFNMHSTEVNAHVKALGTLCKRKASSTSEADALVKKWVQQVLCKACRILEMYISGYVETERENGFSTPPISGGKRGKRVAAMSLEAVTAVHTVGSLVIICPSADTSAVILHLNTIITSGNSDPKFSKLQLCYAALKHADPSLYIQAWDTMGKICLSDGKLAKKYIPLFVQELEKSDCAALRNNLVVMMADFCVRYTALVDCYMSKITKCLRDPCELVRRQTFLLLSRLLQRDYVKWRGVLFLRFLLSLVDESDKIRELADFLFGNILKAKAPLLAYNSFVEAIFYLNDCSAHGDRSSSKNSRIENQLFSLRGNDEGSRSKRMHIYLSLLKQMAPEHLLATFAKLCAEILAAASDAMLNIEDSSVQSVLQDTFQILACKEIRITPSHGFQNDTGDIEEELGDGGGGGGGGGAAAAASAKSRTITQAVKKGLVQNTIPIFIELKRLLESKNSPLTGFLMECLRILLKDYKNEIEDMLVADQQLRRELIYDMQKYEAAKAKLCAAEKTTVPATTTTTTTATTGGGRKDDARVASALADAAAEARARSVLREVKRGVATPPLGSIGMPKLKSNQTGSGSRVDDHPMDVLQSLRRRQSFGSDDES